MSTNNIISFVLEFGVFNGFVVLLAISLWAFRVSSRPRQGWVRTASVWHLVGTLWFMLALVSTVWAAPAEKTFVNGDTLFDLGYERFQKVLIGGGFAGVGILCMLIAVVLTSRQQRAMRRADTAL